MKNQMKTTVTYPRLVRPQSSAGSSPGPPISAAQNEQNPQQPERKLTSLKDVTGKLTLAERLTTSAG